MPERGLPPRMYIPIALVFAALFLAVTGYFIYVGFGVNGSVLGKGGSQATPAPQVNDVQGGGPPPAVMVQVATLKARIASHPNDDVALTQLADMYVAANKFQDAVPLYRQALRANPHNVAAQAGLDEAQQALHGQQ